MATTSSASHRPLWWRFCAAIGRVILAILDYVFTALWRAGAFFGFLYLCMAGIGTIVVSMVLLGFGLKSLDLPPDWDLPQELLDAGPFVVAAVIILVCALVWNRRVKKRHLVAAQGQLTAPSRWRVLVGGFAVFQGLVWLLGLALFAYDHPFDNLILPGGACGAALASIIAGIAITRGPRWSSGILVALASGGVVVLGYSFIRQIFTIAAPISLLYAVLSCVGCAASAFAASFGLRKESKVRVARPVPRYQHSITNTLAHWGMAGIALFLAVFSWSATQDALWEWSVGQEIQSTLRYLDDREALDYARSLTRLHPDDGHAYLLLADLYVGRQRSLSALAAMKAYESVLLANPLEGFRERIGLRYESVKSGVPKIEETLQKRLRRNRAAIFELYRDRTTAIPLLVRFKAEDILRAPARAAPAQAGVLNLDSFSDSGVACPQAEDCRSAFGRASLVAAVMDGTATVRVSAKCCSLGLDDPDLADIDIEPLRTRIAASPGLANFLAITSRMLLKQMYMWNFVANTSASNG